MDLQNLSTHNLKIAHSWGFPMVDISGLSKECVLAALYNNSKVQGFGYLQTVSAEMSVEDASKIVRQSLSFDYLFGKVMKIDISGDEFDPRLYDRDLGNGAAHKVINNLKATGSVEKLSN